MFGCAFLWDETADSFVWVFESILQAMGNKAPKTIFTNQDEAMAKAIKMMLPNTQYFLCTWHFGQNSVQNPNLSCNISENFCMDMKQRLDLNRFGRKWKRNGGMRATLRLPRPYELGHRWSPVFSSDGFSCSIISIHRSENAKCLSKNMSTKTMNLIKLGRPAQTHEGD